MNSTRTTFTLVGLLLLACGEAALGGNYADPSGFSFTYPDGWTPVTRSAMADVKKALPQELKDWVTKNNIDLNRIAVMLIRDGGQEFRENLNVVVENQQIPVTDKTVKELTDTLPRQYAGMGVKVDNFQGRVEKVGGRDAVVVDYQTRMPGAPSLLKQRQVMFPGGGNTYIITCSARADSFDQHLPTFEKVLASFQAPAPAATGLNWARVLGRAVGGAIAGGLFVGLLGVILWISRKAMAGRSGGGTPHEDRD